MGRKILAIVVAIIIGVPISLYLDLGMWASFCNGFFWGSLCMHIAEL